MTTTEQRLRYFRGLAAKDITAAFGVDARNGAEQFIVGTDDSGIILWAPHDMMALIGQDIGEQTGWEIEQL